MPISKKAFKQKVISYGNAPTCKLKKQKPPIGPPGCKVRTLQKEDGKYHFFDKQGKGVMTKTLKTQFTNEPADQAPTLTVLTSVTNASGRNTIYSASQQPSVASSPRIEPKMEFKIIKADGEEYEFEKLIDTGAPHLGLSFDYRTWDWLGFETFDELMAEAEAEEGQPRIDSGTNVHGVTTKFVNFTHPVYVKLPKTGGYVLSKKFPISVGKVAGGVEWWSHYHVVGGKAINKISRYYKT